VDVDGASLVLDGDGTGGDHTSFKQNYATLTAFAQVVYYDHRGNGRSEAGSPDRWTLGQWADDWNISASAAPI
jgi:proline iminopeptidase